MGLLSWLGLRRGDEFPNLDALVGQLRRAMPTDESVIIRYVAIVIVLLGKIAYADGRLTDQEEGLVRALLSHIDRLSPANVDAVCATLKGRLPSMKATELALCIKELKALCDHDQRVQVMRLLAQLAAADGALSESEHAELATIAGDLGVMPSELAAVEEEARATIG